MAKEFLIGLGRNIKKIRKERNMSQLDLSVNCDFEKASLSRLESGKANPTITTLLKVSRGLNVPLIDLFKES
jgi:putative transcriptional regulator